MGKNFTDELTASNHTTLPKAFGSCCIQADKKNKYQLTASAGNRTRKAIEKTVTIESAAKRPGKDVGENIVHFESINVRLRHDSRVLPFLCNALMASVPPDSLVACINV
ncbi:MAG: hypothetical protein HOK57_01975 [Planctomycetaceae bacterium]|jgi:hypothetical protein|nr:hypothetical protein [Planctomycetaceae bacterium]MBT6458574.1 hypothetical protein [Planctomycetaceae bacterium]MBT6643391.1 hypothetical protein [Planctomycetaceae bacterium]MBT6920071.1 hypothetical protein [Planctomycetaceae bacterium]MBT7728593.1 hypothetical protein [Planctomycetaceae bacterium]